MGVWVLVGWVCGCLLGGWVLIGCVCVVLACWVGGLEGACSFALSVAWLTGLFGS